MRVTLAFGLGALLCVTTGVGELSGQSIARVSSPAGDSPNGRAGSTAGGNWKAWISLGSIQGSASAPELYPRSRRSGGNLAIWGTYKLAALSVRTTSIPFVIDETSGIGDRAALLGVHVPLRAHEDFVVALGAGQSFGLGYLVPLHREGMFEAAAQYNLNYRFVGLGIDAMLGTGKTRRFAGGGVSFSLGRFR